MNDFWKENDLDRSQGDLSALGHPQRPRQAQPWRVQQVPLIFTKKLTWCMFMYYFSKINRFKMVPSWSWSSRTPSATLTSSTKASTASTSYVHQNLTRHMFMSYFSKTSLFKTKANWCGLRPESWWGFAFRPSRIIGSLWNQSWLSLHTLVMAVLSVLCQHSTIPLDSGW